MTTNIIKNGSFENGLMNWLVHDLSSPYRELSVQESGIADDAFPSFSSSPTDGNFALLTGFDGNGPGTISIVQEIKVPFGATLTLDFDYRAGWDLVPYGATLPRSFHVDIQTGKEVDSTVLETSTFLTANPGENVNDTGNQHGQMVIQAGGGQTIFVSFEWDITESFTGPGLFQLDNIVLNATHGIPTLGNDVLNGSIRKDIINGLNGDDAIYTYSGNDFLTGGEGEDLLVGGIGKDRYNLLETVAVTDTVQINRGESLVNYSDTVTGFSLGNGSSTASVDKLDLHSTNIASDVSQVDGSDVNGIHSHAISNGIITFDDTDTFDVPFTDWTDSNLKDIVLYLGQNIEEENTVAFVFMNDTYVFQDGGAGADTLVRLVGIQATSLSIDGLADSSVWIS